jgi:hypothetical protein
MQVEVIVLLWALILDRKNFWTLLYRYDRNFRMQCVRLVWLLTDECAFVSVCVYLCVCACVCVLVRVRVCICFCVD